MSKGFSSIHAAAGMKNYLERKVKSEIERNKPGPRNAQVVSIDRDRKKCEVQYPGEEGTVWVPYGSVEPSGTGLKVKIDGPVGDRRIVEVYGKTRSTSRIEHLEAQQTVAPIWGGSTHDWAETFPLMLIYVPSYSPTPHNNSFAHCSPLVIPKDMHIHRAEVKFHREPTAEESGYTTIIRLALHRVDLSDREVETQGQHEGREGDPKFNLIHVASSEYMGTTVNRDTYRIGFTLDDPYPARAGEIFTVSYATYGGNAGSSYHPVIETYHHPTLVQRFGRNQFARGWYNTNLIDGDVPRSEINTNMVRTIWGAVFPDPSGAGMPDSSGDRPTTTGEE